MNYPYTLSDASFQTVRLGVLYYLCTLSYVQIVEMRKVDSNWNLLLAYLAGLVIYSVFVRVFNAYMWITMKCEALSNHDYSFLLDEKVNQHIIIVVGIFEKFDYLSMKNFMLEKAVIIDKCQSKLIKKFGLFWHQKMSDEEWKLNSKNVLKLEQNVHGEEELREFVIKEQSNYDFYDLPQYRWYIIPDFEQNRSALVFKVHHSLTDGLGCSTIFQGFCDSYDSSNLPALRPLSPCK